MPTTIKLKNSVTTTNAPSSLVQGEVAINITDKKVWVGNAATTPIQLLGDGGSASFTSIAFGAGTVSNPSITFTGDTNTGIYSPAADTIAFTEGGVESMRIDSSGNVGIGINSPSYRLHISSTASTAGYFTSSGSVTTIDLDNTNANGWGGNIAIRTGGTAAGYFGTIGSLLGSTAQDLAVYATASNGFRVYTNGNNERMRIDSSGNVGIGTSSFVWSNAGRGLLEINGSTDSLIALKSNNTTQMYMFASTSIAQINATANIPMAFYTNNAERMRIDSSGNVGIGTSSPVADLDIGINGNAAGGNILLGGKTNSTTKYSAIGASHYSNTTYPEGYLLIGGLSTSTDNRVFVGGAYSELRAATSVEFYTAANATTSTGTERMRITSGGDVLVGTTNTAPNAGVGVKIGSDGAEGYVQIVGNTSTNGNVTYRLYSTNAAAYRFYVGYGGTVYATSTTITALSDARLKENIQDIDVGLNKVMALKPRKFDWKTGKGKDIKNDRGWIAQEFEQVFPEMIDTWKDPAPEGEEPYKAVNADLIPVLVKAIQEQQAMIEELKQEVAKLKGV